MKSRHIIALIALAVAAPAAFAAEPATPSTAAKASDAAPENHELAGYADIGAALYKDDLAAAKAAAAKCAKSTDKDFATHAKAIADSADLADARKHFSELSTVAMKLDELSHSLHKAHCPMANGGKGGDWLQASADEVQNPYMGTTMPHCGKIAK